MKGKRLDPRGPCPAGCGDVLDGPVGNCYTCKSSWCQQCREATGYLHRTSCFPCVMKQDSAIQYPGTPEERPQEPMTDPTAPPDVSQGRKPRPLKWEPASVLLVPLGEDGMPTPERVSQAGTAYGDLFNVHPFKYPRLGLDGQMEEPDPDRPEWVVTHIPSGLACSGTFEDDQLAKWWVEAIVPLLPVETWLALDHGMDVPEEVERASRAIYRKIALGDVE